MTARAQLRPQAADAGSHSASGAIDDVRQPMAFADGMGVNGVQMKDAPAPAPKKGKDESKDVGELDGLGKKFQKKAGGLLEKVAREPGQTGRLSVFTNVPIDGAGFIKASFKFMGQVSRGADGKVTMKASVGGGVSAGKEIDLYFATIKAFAAAQVYGYIEAKGDTGEECFQLMALGIHRRLAKINKKLANAVVGKGTVEAAVAGMDDEDYVETGMGVEGVVGAGGEIHPDQDVGGWASAGRQSGERVSKGDDGELKTEKYNQMSQSIGTWLPPFRLSGSYTAKKKDGAMAGIDMSLTGGAMMSIGDIEGRLAGGTFVLDALSRVSKELHKAGKKSPDGEAAQITDEMANQAAARSSAKFVLSGATHAAIKGLNSDFGGMALGFSLSVTSSWTPSGGYKYTVKLQKTDKIDIGKSFRNDLFYVRMENLQDIFEIEV
ncbi:MAG: hypothetical protein GY898_22045 [Proteobacteria bacterium]|nr:hypothetical protein [Pseudomonadota bacterium]